MLLRSILPHPAIAPFVHHFWIFESATGLPAGDARIVVPNGRPKLIVPWRNGLIARRLAETAGQGQREDSPIIVGQWQEATVIASTPEPTVTIGVEFRPHGLTRFFAPDASELSGRIVPGSDVLGAAGRELAERVANAPDVNQAVRAVHAFLVGQFHRSAPQPQVLAEALTLLEQHPMSVNELERHMGYSRRYLHALFLRHVGIGPKSLSGVLSFERLYRRFSQDQSASRLRQDALEVFHDQSHFIHTFRRYTGHSPGRFAELENEFGRIFYTSSQIYKTRVR